MSFKTYYASILLLSVGALTAILFQWWPRVTSLFLVFVSFYFLLQGSRSGFLVLLLSGIGAWLAQGRFLTLRTLQKNIVLLFISLVIGISLALEIYVYSVKRGWMGEEELAKYEMQTDSDVGLLEGRAEVIGALLAIKDSPLIGYGSWAIDKENYGSQMLEYIGDDEAAIIRDRKAIDRDVYMPTHSHIWQSWVWHGFFGGFFWTFVFTVMVRFLKNAVHLSRSLIAYNTLIFSTAFWDLLFSPFSYRPRWGMVFAIMLLGLAEVDRRRKKAALAGTAPDMETPWDGRWNA